MAHEIEEGRDGYYSLCVFNAQNCSDEEVSEVFGKYGQVANIGRSGTTTFVRFETLESAIECYESMQGDPRFNVKTARKKGGSVNGGIKRDVKNCEMSRSNNSRGRKPEMDCGGDFGRPSSAGSSKKPIPKLIPFPATAPKEEGAVVPPPSAKVVIMGNLNPKMGQNNIYELCNKVHAPPLHVAMKILKRPPYPNMSYAVVYVRNEEEVDSIVTSLNNLKLNGYKMVVSAADTLAEEGKTLLSAK